MFLYVETESILCIKQIMSIQFPKNGLVPIDITLLIPAYILLRAHEYISVDQGTI